ncbi:hypothetical protein MCP1_100006 [Candidatus Terasakiella magnetica]|nr:hypothetical protein MCP1_100006 [Candidatus Terasakiella magnetica]
MCIYLYLISSNIYCAAFTRRRNMATAAGEGANIQSKSQAKRHSKLID